LVHWTGGLAEEDFALKARVLLGVVSCGAGAGDADDTCEVPLSVVTGEQTPAYRVSRARRVMSNCAGAVAGESGRAVVVSGEVAADGELRRSCAADLPIVTVWVL